jgi:hypothetical protein
VVAFHRDGEARLQKLVRDLSKRLALCPSVEFFRAVIPVGNQAVQFANENGVVRKVEETGLLACSISEPACPSDQHIRP